MARVKLQDALRARRSATARYGTLRRIRRRWSHNYTSPLAECGDAFESNIRTIEREYEDIISRVNRAVENVEVEV